MKAYLTGGAIGIALVLGAVLLGATIAACGTPFADIRIATALSAWRAAGGFWSVITTLGDAEIRLPIAVLLVVTLTLMHRRADAFLLGATVAIGMGLNSLLKLLFARPRPDLLPHLDMVTSHSFPSGHAAHSATLYLLIALFAGSIVNGRNVRIAIIGAAAALILLIGLSRIVLGVHWPSDILAGWGVGTGFALIAWSLRTRMIRRLDYQPRL